MTTRETIYKSIEAVGYATIPHLMTYLYPNNTSGSKYTLIKRHLNNMIDEGLINRKTLYAPGRLMNRIVYFTDRFEKYKPNEWDHDYGLTDTLLSIWFKYKDAWIVEIYRNFKFVYEIKGKKFSYRPDALVRLTDDRNETFDYVIEFERSRHKGEELDKIAKIPLIKNLTPYKLNMIKKKKSDKDKPLFKSQLSKYTQFVFVICRSNVFKLEFDYRDENYALSLKEYDLPKNVCVVPYRSLYI